MKHILWKKLQTGFTLIETMIAMTIFTVLVTVGMGAVLNAMNQHALAQNMRTAMDNLNFVMEDMSRNIRLGTNFHCFNGDSGSGLDGSGIPVPQNCAGSHEIIFSSLTPGVTITYLITNTTPVQIEKIVGSGSPEIFTPPEVIVDYLKSGFFVVGAPQGDGIQPTINIGLSGSVLYKDLKSTFSVQTTVASRPLDG